MKVEFWLNGKSEAYIKQAFEMYEKRLKRYINFETVLLTEPRNKKKLNEEELKKAEGEMMLARLEPTDHLVLLDERGRRMSSKAFASMVNHLMVNSTRRVVFVVGGAYGFSEGLYARANESLSLSDMTFSHQVIRVIFLEQLYRAFTIMNNEPYHHG